MSGSEKTKVYVSYAWGPEKEADPDRKVVDRLAEALRAADLELRRDIKYLGYGESIREFMREIGTADHIVLVLSDAYLKSPNCMFELFEVEQNGKLRDRVHSVVLSDAKIYDTNGRTAYVNYWEKQRNGLEATIRSAERLTNIDGEIKDLRLCENTCGKLDGLMRHFSDPNALTPEAHLATDFADLIARIKKTAPQPDSAPRQPDSQFINDVVSDINRLLGEFPGLAKEGASALRDFAVPGSPNAAKWRGSEAIRCARLGPGHTPATAAKTGKERIAPFRPGGLAGTVVPHPVR